MAECVVLKPFRLGRWQAAAKYGVRDAMAGTVGEGRVTRGGVRDASAASVYRKSVPALVHDANGRVIPLGDRLDTHLAFEDRVGPSD
jgi:hypothetical protein